MKILITGSNGFLGRHIKANLCIYDVFELNRKTGDYIYFLEQEVPSFNQQFDLVIHCAGKAHSVPKSEFEKEEFFKVNVTGTRNLLDGLALSNALPKSFVFISSVAVYGKIEGESISENSPLLAQDAYGRSKIVAEELVRSWCDEHNVGCTILRLPLLVGENPPGNLGVMINGIKKGFYFNINGGVAKKSMVLASDVASHIIKAAEKGGVYNLTDGYHPNFYELALNISNKIGKGKHLNLPLSIAKIMAKVGDLMGGKAPINTLKLKKITSNLTFDDTKARKSFNWNPQSVLSGIKVF